MNQAHPGMYAINIMEINGQGFKAPYNHTHGQTREPISYTQFKISLYHKILSALKIGL